MHPEFPQILSAFVPLSSLFVIAVIAVETGGTANPNSIQVSVGIEHIDDIIADFEEALKVVPSV